MEITWFNNQVWEPGSKEPGSKEPGYFRITWFKNIVQNNVVLKTMSFPRKPGLNQV